MEIFADVSYGTALKEGVFNNGVTVVSWLPYIVAVLGVLHTYLQKLGILDLLKSKLLIPDAPVNPDKPTDPKVPENFTGLLDMFNGNLPLIEWFLTLPPDRRDAFWVAVKKRLGV